MNIIGIVCEYNPFHNGHAYQINRSRETLGEDSAVVCVMSGDYVQRGEPAFFSKFARAEAACRCGADLVVELPLPWALSSAENFARGAVSMLAALGCTHLSFGSESGELEALKKLARSLNDPMILAEIKACMADKPTLSFAAARQIILENYHGENAKLIETPNNILAIEYLKAIHELDLDITPLTVKRKGSAHDMFGENEIKSASELRQMLGQGESIAVYVPRQALAVYKQELEQGRTAADKAAVELVLLSRLRMLGGDAYLALPDSGDGVGQRLCKAAKEESSLELILTAAKTKRIAMSRLRRMCLCAALGIDREMSAGLPPYARVLSVNSKGRGLLREIDGKTTIPVITKPAHIKDIGEKAEQVFAVCASAHDMYTLSYSSLKDKKGGSDWRTGPKIV